METIFPNIFNQPNKVRQKIKILAFYLPQYHSIPENDAWWGNGFTEWTNVTKAYPLFAGHLKPNLPSELGLYDLRDPEIRSAQANLAKSYGIDGFIYWHYWFGNGQQLLEKPFHEVLNTCKPDFPFCLAWANQSWTGIWHREPERTLMRQTYPGDEDILLHFQRFLPAFHDDRYIREDGRPLFIVYQPQDIPERRHFTDLWNNLAVKNGLDKFFFVGFGPPSWNYHSEGFDARTEHQPSFYIRLYEQKLSNKLKGMFKRHLTRIKPFTVDYPSIVREYNRNCFHDPGFIHTLIPNWDNTPRCGRKGWILHNSSPETFREHFGIVYHDVYRSSGSHKMIFIKSWNELAEGNYLEPDQLWGRGYLEAIHSVIQGNRNYESLGHHCNA